MSQPLRFNLDTGDARSASLDGLFYAAANLSREQRYVVSVMEWHPPLPRNLLARIKIPVRELALHMGWPYPQMNAYVKAQFYPTEFRTVKGKRIELPKETMDLTPAEAREVEIHIVELAVEWECPLSSPQSRGVRV